MSNLSKKELFESEIFKKFKLEYLDLLKRYGWKPSYKFYVSGIEKIQFNLNSANKFIRKQVEVILKNPPTYNQINKVIGYQEIGWQRKGANQLSYDESIWDSPCVLDKETLEPIDMNEYEIDSIVGVLTNQEEIKKFENANNIQSFNMTYKDVKRNDVIYLTCLLKPRNSSSAYPTGEIGVLMVKVINTYYGLSKLKQLASQKKIL